MQILYLPQEVITYIFLRLPVKTLSVLKCVNKFCLHVISTPDFMKTHLKVSTEDATLSCYNVILASGSPFCSIKQFSIQLLLLLSEYFTTLVNLDYPKKNSRRSDVLLVGSCNGLVCIVMNDKHLFLWNPCTGKYRKLRDLDIDTSELPDITYGFGYDESNDDYKVVGIFQFHVNQPSCPQIVNVYSLKRNSWKRIEDIEIDLLDFYMAEFASGKLHWFLCPLSAVNYRRAIVSFDVENEVFGMVEQPNYGEGRWKMTLSVLGECICVLCNDKQIHADLWVMKEYGVMESWTKVVTISCFDIIRKYYLRPLSLLPNGEVLLDTGRSFILYNPKDDSFRFPVIRKFRKLQPFVYVQSLVSPIRN